MVCEGQGRLSVLSDKGCRLQKYKTSLISLDIAVGFTNVSQVCLRTLSNFSIPISSHNPNVLFWCLVYGLLELLVYVVDLNVIISRCWCIILYKGDIERNCSQTDREVCLRLLSILRQHSPCTYALEIQSNTHVCPLLH